MRLAVSVMRSPLMVSTESTVGHGTTGRQEREGHVRGGGRSGASASLRAASISAPARPATMTLLLSWFAASAYSAPWKRCVTGVAAVARASGGGVGGGAGRAMSHAPRDPDSDRQERARARESGRPARPAQKGGAATGRNEKKVGRPRLKRREPGRVDAKGEGAVTFRGRLARRRRPWREVFRSASRERTPLRRPQGEDTIEKASRTGHL